MKIIMGKLELLQSMANPDGKWTCGLDCGPRFGIDFGLQGKQFNDDLSNNCRLCRQPCA